MQEARQDGADPHGEAWRSPLDELERTVVELGKAISSLRRTLEAPALKEVVPPSDAPARPFSAEPPEGPTPKVDVVEDEDEDEHAPEQAPGIETGAAGFKDVWERLKRERQEPEPPDTPAPNVDVLPDVETRDEDEHAPEGPHDIETGAAGFKDVWDRLQRERQEREQDGEGEELSGLRGLGDLPQDYRITIEDKDGTPVDLVPIHRALLNFAGPADVSLMSFANGVPVVALRTHGELDLEQLGETIGTVTARECEVIQQDRGKLFLRLSSDEGDRA